MAHAAFMNIQSPQGGNNNQNHGVISMFQGYPTRFDVNLNQWQPLCANNCTIEVSLPPMISLRQQPSEECFHFIELQSDFQHHLSGSDSILILTSSEKLKSQTYGIRLSNDAALHLTTSLNRLTQFYKKQTYGNEKPPVPLKQNFVNTVNVNKNKNKNENTYCEIQDVTCTTVAVDEEAITSETALDENLYETLSTAIERGDVNEAKRIVTQLAKQNIKLRFASQPDDNDAQMNVDIQVESKDTYQPIPIRLAVDPHTMTVRDLKYQMYEKYKFPIPVQHWVISNRLAKDEETLYYSGVKKDDTKIYLYLKAMYHSSVTKTIQTDEDDIDYAHQMNSQMNPQMNPQINPQINPVIGGVEMNPLINSIMYQQMNPQMNQQLNRQLNPQLNPQMNAQLNQQFWDIPKLSTSYVQPNS